MIKQFLSTTDDRTKTLLSRFSPVPSRCFLKCSFRSLLTPTSWNILCNFEVYSKPHACCKGDKKMDEKLHKITVPHQTVTEYEQYSSQKDTPFSVNWRSQSDVNLLCGTVPSVLRSCWPLHRRTLTCAERGVLLTFCCKTSGKHLYLRCTWKRSSESKHIYGTNIAELPVGQWKKLKLSIYL